MNSLISRSMVSAFALALIAACTSKSPDGPAGGAVSGALDSHCGTTKLVVNQSICQAPAADARQLTCGRFMLHILTAYKIESPACIRSSPKPSSARM